MKQATLLSLLIFCGCSGRSREKQELPAEQREPALEVDLPDASDRREVEERAPQMDGKQMCGLSSAQFDRRCAKDSDCIAVFEGDLCQTEACATACPNAAISKAGKAAYDTFIARAPTSPDVDLDCGLHRRRRSSLRRSTVHDGAVRRPLSHEDGIQIRCPRRRPTRGAQSALITAHAMGLPELPEGSTPMSSDSCTTMALSTNERS